MILYRIAQMLWLIVGVILYMECGDNNTVIMLICFALSAINGIGAELKEK